MRFARIAEEMAALGITVDKPATSARVRAGHRGRPVIIDVRTDIRMVARLPVS